MLGSRGWIEDCCCCSATTTRTWSDQDFLPLDGERGFRPASLAGSSLPANHHPLPSFSQMGISRDSRHKRSASGAKRAFYRKKRKFELGRQGAFA